MFEIPEVRGEVTAVVLPVPKTPTDVHNNAQLNINQIPVSAKACDAENSTSNAQADTRAHKLHGHTSSATSPTFDVAGGGDRTRMKVCSTA